jgi:fibro-slime domain-containing protein
VIKARVSALVLGWLALAGCSRTGLWLADPCADEGATTACEDACGEGVSTCRDGVWSRCEVPEITRSCENTCGEGAQSCSDGRWGSCDVPLRVEDCEGLCGAGTRVCSDGRFGACEIPPTDFPCENVCGAGLQHCEDERLGLCEVPIAQRDCASACGPGHETCIDGAWQACDAPQPNPPVLNVTIRDFSPLTHPDFERNQMMFGAGLDRNIVEERLGDDEKPVYSGDPSIFTVDSRDSFYEWYHDSPRSIAILQELALDVSAVSPGFYVYDNRNFFPIDNLGWGNEGRSHNYHFTLEAKLTFRYVGGELFSFRGDDDMWVFINRQLAINLGGLHQPESSSVSLDANAAKFGLVLGEVYPIHIFFAERHTIESNFTLETSVADQGSCR